MTDQSSDPGPSAGKAFEQRMEAFGHEVEEAAQRVSQSPEVKAGVDVAARIWGLVLLGFGVWFLAETTFGYDLPSLPWRDLWPLALVLLGGLIVLRGASRRA